MSARVPTVIFASLLLGACVAPESAPAPGDGADPGFRAMDVAEQLAPLARFLGDWEGTSENLRGTFTVARRISWLVPGSWLLEQSRVLDPNSGEELSRSATLHTFDSVARQLRSESLGAGGDRDVAWLMIDAAAGVRTLHASPGAPATGAFRTLRYSGGAWDAAVYVPDAEAVDGWREVERLSLKRRDPGVLRDK